MMLDMATHIFLLMTSSRITFALRAVLNRMLPLLCVLVSSTVVAETVPDEALDCLIEPWVVSDVGSPVQGVIARLLVDRGESVSRGQAVAQLESGVESAEVALAEARAIAESEVLAREADLTLAEMELARLDDLYRQNMVPAQQRDEATARFQIASAALTQALENRKTQQMELTRTRRQYARRVLTSPVTGIVVAQLAFAGEFVYDNPVMTIAALDPLRVEVMLPSRLFGTIEVGDKARLFPELGDAAPLIATVDVVDAMLNSRSGTFGVRLKLSNPDFAIPAGQRCRIVFGPAMAAAKSDKGNPQAESGRQ
ncbi:MAG: efflux RND transporter periplasmic adaptor subunit [Granulosicoccus sp.]